MRANKASIMVATFKLEDALISAEKILAREPTNIIANMAKARYLIFRKQYRQALKIYQATLRIAPRCLPDPRIGVGICFWHLGDQETAQKAWRRSIAVHDLPKSMPAYTLLGLSSLNQTKQMQEGSEEHVEKYREAIGYLQVSFKSVKTVASSAIGLANHFLASSNWSNVILLAFSYSRIC